MAETINGLYKAEVIWRQPSWPSVSAVEMATKRWVDGINQYRLFAPSGETQTAETEANRYAAREPQEFFASSNEAASGKPPTLKGVAKKIKGVRAFGSCDFG